MIKVTVNPTRVSVAPVTLTITADTLEDVMELNRWFEGCSSPSGNLDAYVKLQSIARRARKRWLNTRPSDSDNEW